ncbi:hypothetical protein RchiOBHm_Chr6g0262141 [Rosa chinensis]|uniref:Uncharacterized protein n=1 Tax=Rosa chinensis TaxID=74649 RepID=A0A2P6PNJ7_ROSCH|nr:hypothetical protein RchiOBHm_Chr6g0262141 [Rosa chinensis]
MRVIPSPFSYDTKTMPVYESEYWDGRHHNHNQGYLLCCNNPKLKKQHK